MNKTNGIKTTKIGKKDYVEVDERIRLFWELHPNWTILTEMIYNCEENLVCIFKAKIIDENDVIKATGHAREFQADKKSMVNKTSHVENCETSAIGRALGIKGIITEYGIASANEVRNAKELEKELDKIQVEESKVQHKSPVNQTQRIMEENEIESDPVQEPEEPAEELDENSKMLKSILGKSVEGDITSKLISLNAKAMKIKTDEEGSAVASEYRELVAEHGEENLPKSLREVVLSSLTAAKDKITRDKLA